MAYIYHPVEEKDDLRSDDEESQGNENLLGTRKPCFMSSRSNIFWIILHLLVTLVLLAGLRFQSRQTRDTTCPKLLPLELRKYPSPV